jgi:ubiquinone/menaquinone biosynthesis C-methylase UbiE
MSRKYQNIQDQHWYSQSMLHRKKADDPMIEHIFKHKTRRLAERLPQKNPPRNSLDCGCGNGYFQYYLKKHFQHPCLAFDYSLPMLATSPCKAHSVQADFCSIPFPDDSFDLVCQSGTFHHLTKEVEKKAIEEMIRVSRRFVFFSEPNRNNPVMFLFGIFSPKERRSLVFHRRRLLRYAKKYSCLKIVDSWLSDGITPNLTPRFLFNRVKNYDVNLALMCNVLYEKTDEN